MSEEETSSDLDQVEEILLRHSDGEGTSADRSSLSADARAAVDAFLLAESAVIGDATPPQLDDPREQRLGPYVLLRSLGGGSQGIVYHARHRRLGREVALKVLHDSAPHDVTRVTRFRREASLSSRLQHPAICTVFETGEADGRPWIATQRVDGPSLAKVLEERDQPPCSDEVASLLLLGEQISEGLAAAHREGVIHRDVKPANILLDGTGRPIIVDFGLARERDREGAAMTQPNVPFGTPAYMAPEQVSGNTEADHRADIWSLGATLYEIMTGHRPFSGPTRDALYHAILSTDPLGACRLNQALPPDLEVVLRTALEKDVDRRYRSADALAEDLRRIREHRPILARRTRTWLRIARWCRRNRLVSALMIVVTAALMIVLASLSATRQSLDEANGFRSLAEARLAIERHPVRALRLATEGAVLAPGMIARDTVMEVLNEPLPASIHRDHVGEVLGLAFSPDSRSIATCGSGGRIVVRETSGSIRWQHQEAEPIGALAVSHDGKRIAWGVGDQIQVVDLSSGEVLEKRSLAQITPEASPSDRVSALTYHLHGDLAVGTTEGLVALVDLTGGNARWTIHAHEGNVKRIAFDPAFERLASAGEDEGVHLISTSNGQNLATLAHQWGLVSDVCFRPHRNELTTASSDNTAWLWDTETARPIRGFDGHESGVHVSQFDADGKWILTASWDRTARIWNPDRRKPFRVLRGHQASIEVGAFSPDGHWIATGDEAGEVRLWRIVDPTAVMAFPTSIGGGTAAALSPNGTRLFAPDSQRSAILWDTSTGRAMHRITDYQSRVVSAGFSPDRRRLVSSSADGAIFIHGLETGALLHQLSIPGSTRSGSLIVIHPSKELFAAATESGVGMIASSRTGQVVHRIEGTVQVGGAPIYPTLAFTADGESLVTVDPNDDTTLRVYGVATGVESARFSEHADSIYTIVTHPRGPWVCSTSRDGTARIWSSLDPDTHVALDHGGEAVTNASFIKDGERIATGTDAGRVRIFEVASGKLIAEWLAHDSMIYTIDASGDGSQLVTASWDQRARVWDARTGQLLMTLASHQSPVFSARFTPNNAQVLSAGQDGTTRLWPADPVKRGLQRTNQPPGVQALRSP